MYVYIYIYIYYIIYILYIYIYVYVYVHEFRTCGHPQLRPVKSKPLLPVFAAVQRVLHGSGAVLTAAPFGVWPVAKSQANRIGCDRGSIL